jgi:hypothetical protein
MTKEPFSESTIDSIASTVASKLLVSPTSFVPPQPSVLASKPSSGSSLRPKVLTASQIAKTVAQEPIFKEISTAMADIYTLQKQMLPTVGKKHPAAK